MKVSLSSLDTAQRRLATYLARASRHNESVIIKHGSSQAWLIPIPQYKRIQQILSNLNASSAVK
jgi:prevent-host-death family protein